MIHVGTADTRNVGGHTSLIALEVLNKLLSQALSSFLVGIGVRPAVDGAEDLRVYTEALAGDLEVEPLHDVEV